MNILFATSEVTPLAKTGGLGDVLAALPARLRGRGHSVSVVLPGYRVALDALPDARDTGLRFSVPMGSAKWGARIWQARTREDVVLFLVVRDELFDRRGLYGHAEGDYEDNAGRFIFFSKAVAELASHLRPRPEILHLHDWQTALAAAVVRQKANGLRTVLTIHNMAYQGIFPSWDYDLTNLPPAWFAADGLEFYGAVNLLKGGILYADQVTTVSPTYAREIQTAEFGCGLDGVLHQRKSDLTGILNGIDDEVWNPATDRWITRNYAAGEWEGKAACREHLLQGAGLDPEKCRGPVFGCISRLVSQKGLDLVEQVLPEIVAAGGSLVLLGSGQPELEELFHKAAQTHPGAVSVRIGFDEAWAHQIESGADFFLMPSRFEPCGLNQMYSQRYGTIPIVHATGGLADSVEDWDPAARRGGGLVFSPCTASALSRTLERAFTLYRDGEAWKQIRSQAMARDFSWAAAAADYEVVYERACGTKPAREEKGKP